MATEYPYVQSISISNYSNSSHVTGSCTIQQGPGMSTHLALDTEKCLRVFSLLFDMVEEDVKRAALAMQELKRPPALEAPKASIDAEVIEAEPVPDGEAKPMADDDYPF